MILLEAKRLSRTLGQMCLFRNLNLKVQSGSVILLKGANGSGKTTFLKTLAGAPTDTGEVLLGACPVLQRPTWEREMLAPLVDQIPIVDLDVLAIDNLIDCVTVGTSSLDWLTSSRRKLRRKIIADLASTIEIFGLDDAMLRPAIELSYGQRRLLTILRALRPLANGLARVLLLDEPLAGLHTDKVNAVLTMVQKRLESGWAVIAAEHLPAITRLRSTAEICFPSIHA